MKRNLYLVLLFTLFLISCNSCSDPVVPPKEENVRVVWSYYRDYNFNVIDIMKPVIVDDKVFIAHDHHLVCCNLSNGQEKWNVDIGNINSLDSRKLLYDNNRLFLNWHHYVYSFKTENGALNWKTVIPDFNDRGLKYLSQNNSYIFIPGKGKFAKINKQDGSIALIKEIKELVPDSVLQLCGAMNVTNDDYIYVPTGYYRKNYIAANEGSLLCYSSITGEFIWGFKVPNHKVFLSGSPDSSYTDADVSECSVYGDYVAFQAGNSVFLLNRFTSEVIWENIFDRDGFFSIGILLFEDKVYASATSGNLYCLSASNGEILWQVDTYNSLITLFTLNNKRLYFTNDLGSGIWIIDKDSGKVIWNGQPPEYNNDDHYAYFSPVETNGKYMINVGTRKIYCLTVP